MVFLGISSMHGMLRSSWISESREKLRIPHITIFLYHRPRFGPWYRNSRPRFLPSSSNPFLTFQVSQTKGVLLTKLYRKDHVMASSNCFVKYPAKDMLNRGSCRPLNLHYTIKHHPSSPSLRHQPFYEIINSLVISRGVKIIGTLLSLDAGQCLWSVMMTIS